MQYGTTPILDAALNGHMDVVNLLLSEGAAMDGLDQVKLFITLSCWQCYSVFGLMVRHICCKRRASAAMGEHEYGFCSMTGLNERYSLWPTVFVNLVHVGQKAVHKEAMKGTCCCGLLQET